MGMYQCETLWKYKHWARVVLNFLYLEVTFESYFPCILQSSDCMRSVLRFSWSVFNVQVFLRIPCKHKLNVGQKILFCERNVQIIVSENLTIFIFAALTSSGIIVEFLPEIIK